MSLHQPQTQLQTTPSSALTPGVSAPARESTQQAHTRRVSPYPLRARTPTRVQSPLALRTSPRLDSPQERTSPVSRRQLHTPRQATPIRAPGSRVPQRAPAPAIPASPPPSEQFQLVIKPIIESSVGQRETSGETLSNFLVDGATFQDILKSLWEKFRPRIKG
ncbi:hypothetical protein F441_18677 [Phytophthora nicotianae CJ01A1]|uniref:Uncharacterized protein n=2 Tax=Phytophthora nicotianae TaxID=4792 RepID=W2MF37_PHYNI|nr:hypothetical protein L915_18292 [Phytophthora nicotianae]ETL28454.1 hypothetical protein L916_18201 [Phytophthora nicotianae]ETM34915.1 hypothetical protein L914_18099 [Phytophthora nicotianae]ETP04583.1 hypothetical protein F441_18677 [Phytophthora nicotianae CJ01A1]